jgi:hypothetical protein
MAKRTLRSHTVELNQDGVEFTAGEEDDHPSMDEVAVLGSADEQIEETENVTQQVASSETRNLVGTGANVGRPNIVEVREESTL